MEAGIRKLDKTHRAGLFAEHSRVRLRRNLSQYELPAGTLGTVVHVYAQGNAFEVEFGADGESPRVVTLDSSDVDPLAD